jgi:hypothetical protein
VSVENAVSDGERTSKPWSAKLTTEKNGLAASDLIIDIIVYSAAWIVKRQLGLEEPLKEFKRV